MRRQIAGGLPSLRFPAPSWWCRAPRSSMSACRHVELAEYSRKPFVCQPDGIKKECQRCRSLHSRAEWHRVSGVSSSSSLQARRGHREVHGRLHSSPTGTTLMRGGDCENRNQPRHPPLAECRVRQTLAGARGPESGVCVRKRSLSRDREGVVGQQRISAPCYVFMRERKYRPASANSASGDHPATAAGSRSTFPSCSNRALTAR